MRRFRALALALTLALAPATPSAATVATIATTVPLQDHQQRSIDAALRTALKATIAGATAMGLPWVRINHALVLEDAVAVQILATDTVLGPDGAQEGPETDGGADSETGAPSEGSL